LETELMFILAVPALMGVLAIPAGRIVARPAVQPVMAGVVRTEAPLQLTGAVVATHSTKGVVKAIDADTLVITRSVRHGKEMTFVLDSSTRREGSVVVGTMVEVRYRTEASRRVAAVVSAQETKRQ
jgi:3-hydroxymyristoyl/3-hydroxydecanoyl-(acyl carrier protein) dehydratase